MTEGNLIVDGEIVTFTKSEKAIVLEKQRHYDVDETPPGEIGIKETTELGDSLKELNKDSIERGTRMSGIDMRSRLHHMEIASILAVDSLVGFKFLPVSCLAFTRQKKRLSVSLAGKGRDDIVNIVSGKQEQDAKKAGMGIGERVKSYFGGGNKESG